MLRSRTPAAFLIKTLALNSPYWIIQIDPTSAEGVMKVRPCRVMYRPARGGACPCTPPKQWVGFQKQRLLYISVKKEDWQKQRPWKMLTNSGKRQERERGENKEELYRHEREERGQQGGSSALCVYDWMRWVSGFHTHLWMLILSRAQAGLIFTARLNEGAD